MFKITKYLPETGGRERRMMDHFEEQKLSLLEREVALKEREFSHRVSQSRDSHWRSPMVVAIMVAALGAFSNAASLFLSSKFNREQAGIDFAMQNDLANLSAENARVLEMIKIGDSEQVRKNLEFLIETSLVSDPQTVLKLQEYYASKAKGEGPGASATKLDPEYLRGYLEYMDSLDLEFFDPIEFLVLGNSSNDPKNPAYGLNDPPPPELWQNIGAIANVMDEFRRRHGAPVKLVSAYRSIEYNKRIGGSVTSLHLTGLAVDFTSEFGTPEEWKDLLRVIRNEGLFKGGIGTHQQFVHVDVRGKNSDW